MNIVERLEFRKSRKDHFLVSYFGRAQDLRREAIRLLNAIDGLNLPEESLEEKAPGTGADRWE